VNAAILAVQIIGLENKSAAKKMEQYKKELVRKIEAKNRRLKR
jgi:phosphoribosylcarboxyaminoimidazole (NCAIR) mutase